jgi:hypothetical protein
MLFRSADLRAIVEGTRTLAFRRWKRPTTAPGRTIKTQMGLVGIDSIEAVDPATISEAEAREAGYKDRAALMAMFDAQEGTCYRIRLHYAGEDNRPQLGDNADLSEADRDRIRKRLEKHDAKSEIGPWTAATLRVIAEHPAVVSRELARLLGRERDPLKEDIRKLKALGLTTSLEVGYCLSPRGAAYLKGT